MHAEHREPETAHSREQLPHLQMPAQILRSVRRSCERPVPGFRCILSSVRSGRDRSRKSGSESQRLPRIRCRQVQDRSMSSPTSLSEACLTSGTRYPRLPPRKARRAHADESGSVSFGTPNNTANTPIQSLLLRTADKFQISPE